MSGEAITVREMVLDQLRRMGADGLYCEVGECGCGLSDLMPCDSPCDRCVPARVVHCPECGTEVYIPMGELWQKHANA